MAGGAILIALGAWIYAVVAIRRERQRRHQRVQEAVWQWAGQAATKEEVSKLRAAVGTGERAQLSEDVQQVENAMASLGAKVDELAAAERDDSRLDDLRRAVAEMSDRLTKLEAEDRSRVDEQTPSHFPRFPRR
jgi:ubiquinone biosynthesis protein UbiJ